MTDIATAALPMADPDRIGANTDGRGSYFGGKGGEGVWQTIINQMPPHDLFIEAFAGSAAITRFKRPATSTICIDADAAVCRSLHGRFADAAGAIVICADAVSWLKSNRGTFTERTLIYCDPPYLFDCRDSGRQKRYGVELGEAWQHPQLLCVLNLLTAQGVRCLVSGYRSELYDRTLKDWRRVDYTAPTRGGPRTESLWCNYPEPTALHDYRFIGKNFRERQDLKRKRDSWTRRFAAMPPIERSMILEALIGVDAETRGK